MPWKLQRKLEQTTTQARAWVFLWLVWIMVQHLNLGNVLFASLPPSSSTIAEDLNSDEKREMITQLLAEGDKQMAARNYNMANAHYESVFLLDPAHIEASRRIDRLKKRMVKEGHQETELVARVYDSELDERVRQYLTEAKQLLKEQKLAQARFKLQKLLLLNPLHGEANKLYREVNRKLDGGVS